MGFLKVQKGAATKGQAGVPKIVLEGAWLVTAGFTTGQYAFVDVCRDGKIELTRIGGGQ
jgi:hypothetical protein